DRGPRGVLEREPDLVHGVGAGPFEGSGPASHPVPAVRKLAVGPVLAPGVPGAAVPIESAVAVISRPDELQPAPNQLPPIRSDGDRDLLLVLQGVPERT